jgi:hypothetical protein
MGMFDEFIIKIPIQCPHCHTGAHKRFQTKELDCNLDVYYEGEPAHQYGLRDMNEDEIDEEKIYNQIHYPEGSLFENFPFLAIDKTNIIKTLDDGRYAVYGYCYDCDSFFYVCAVVKKGIFVGIEPCGD